uniref:Uncharacterized protein n=1 Tax=Cucumis melo TaxID=3656 RepID=A0A9I9EGK2_CUCME
MYASVTDIIPNMDDQSKISGQHAANSFKPPESKKDKSWPPTFIHDIRFKLHKLHKIEFRISEKKIDPLPQGSHMRNPKTAADFNHPFHVLPFD